MAICKAVIIAAGPGKRLMPTTANMHKTLIPFAGKPLISHILLSVKEWGISEVIVVVGYMAKTVRFFVGDGRVYGLRIKYVNNPNYYMGNGISMLSAKRKVGSKPFLLLMSDHLFDSNILGKIICENEFSLCVDSEMHYLLNPDEATKVLMDKKNYILDIGKNLQSWNGADVGIFLCEPVIFDAIKTLRKERYKVSLTDAIKFLVTDYGFPIRGLDVSGSFWLDIDTLDDFNHAKRILGDASAGKVGWHNFPTH
ncbi:MAG: phosphocholine cytidylyltransferase family protein [Candidatus Jordarchaeum sp.]|uniref:phosphocholine cytidylyltransferase family protein n=1 Tax=Candidatus Jordarchaeum sp. TaxID=2823881 RepID=UPI004049084A